MLAFNIQNFLKAIITPRPSQVYFKGIIPLEGEAKGPSTLS